jgi:hypothetical protein
MRQRLLLVGIVLLLALPLVLLLRDFAREVLLVELMRIFWGARILFESLPQLPLWVLVLLAVLVIAASSLRGARLPMGGAVGRPVPPGGRVRTLARWIERASEGEYFRWKLARYLGDLTWQVMAHRERTTPQDLKQRLNAGGLDLPPAVETYLQAARVPSFGPGAGSLVRLWQRLRRGRSSFPPDPTLESVIQFLEDQLEVQHDHDQP